MPKRILKSGIKWKEFSDKHKKNISEANKGKVPWNKGKKCPQISAKLKGRKISWIDKIVKTNRKLYQEGKLTGWWKGKKFSAKHRKKISERHKGKIPWNKGTKGLLVSKFKGRPIPWFLGNKYGFQKGHIPWNKGKKTYRRNYKKIEGKENLVYSLE